MRAILENFKAGVEEGVADDLSPIITNQIIVSCEFCQRDITCNSGEDDFRQYDSE